MMAKKTSEQRKAERDAAVMAQYTKSVEDYVGTTTDHNAIEGKLATVKIDPLKFFEEQPLYEDLSREVEYIVRKRLKRDGIAVGIITSRTKSYKSFRDKLVRPEYQRKPVNIRDRAGVRLVYLYKSDLAKIEAAIKDEFAIVDKKDTATDQDPERFGYSDVKLYVKLKKQAGPRYDDLKHLLCEIQVRTVGQDAWALVSRDLVYNKESQIPKKHRRALNGLVSFFEHADEKFDSIRRALEQERKDMATMQTKEFLEHQINADTLIAFILKEFTIDREIKLDKIQKDSLVQIIDWLHAAGYNKLKQLAAIREQACDLRNWNEAWRQKRGWAFHPMVLFELALATVDPTYKANEREAEKLLTRGIDLFSALRTALKKAGS